LKRYLLCVLTAFLLETLLLALLQDRPTLAPYMPKPDQALTYAFGLAWVLGLVLFFIRRKRKTAPAKRKGKGKATPKAKSKSTAKSPSKSNKKSGTRRAAKSS
jgi:hypothetical protein